VLSELKSCGVADVWIVCCDGLTGLPDAIGVTWPQAAVQLCVVHLIRARCGMPPQVLGAAATALDTGRGRPVY
jgi:transposase-like protein